MLNKAIKRLDNTSDYLSSEVKPEVEHFVTSKQDLKVVIEDVDWKNLKNWQDVKDVKWDLIEDKAKNFDRHAEINWTRLENQAKEMVDRIDHEEERRVQKEA